MFSTVEHDHFLEKVSRKDLKKLRTLSKSPYRKQKQKKHKKEKKEKKDDLSSIVDGEGGGEAATTFGFNCGTCGCRVQIDSNFCPKCGAPTGRPITALQEATRAMSPPRSRQRKRMWSRGSQGSPKR